MKRAFLVLGPESSGTRFVTQLLIDAGCHGESCHVQGFDLLDEWSQFNLPALPPDERPIVWRRSYPHEYVFADIRVAVRQLRGAGYDVMAVITTRDWYPMIRSQIASQHVADEASGLSNARQAYRAIFQQLPEDAPYIVVSYESFSRQRNKAVRKMLELLNLPMPETITLIEDGNAKWYRES
jgi:LPS sulfotransferase NodH